MSFNSIPAVSLSGRCLASAQGPPAVHDVIYAHALCGEHCARTPLKPSSTHSSLFPTAPPRGKQADGPLRLSFLFSSTRPSPLPHKTSM